MYKFYTINYCKLILLIFCCNYIFVVIIYNTNNNDGDKLCALDFYFAETCENILKICKELELEDILNEE